MAADRSRSGKIAAGSSVAAPHPQHAPLPGAALAVLGLVLICTSTVRADIAPFELSIYAVRRLVDTMEHRLWSICSILSGRPPQDPTPLGC